MCQASYMYYSVLTKLMMLMLAPFYRQRSRGADLDWGHLAGPGGGCPGIKLRSADAVAFTLCFFGVIKIISASLPLSEMDKSTKKLRVSSRWWPGGPLAFNLLPSHIVTLSHAWHLPTGPYLQQWAGESAGTQEGPEGLTSWSGLFPGESDSLAC